MLREFRVHDFALADDLTVALGEGLNVITGETGSGKSVLVNAISLLLGRKPAGNMVRAGGVRAALEGVFEWRPAGALLAELEDAGLELQDGELIIQREITEAGRSTSRINARAVTGALLRSVGEHLADLHGQYDHQALLRKNDHTEFLDMLGPASHIKLAEGVAEKHRKLRARVEEKKKLESERRRREDERDLLKFRINEIESVVESEESHAELERDARLLEHAAELAAAAAEADEMIGRDGSDTTALNRLAAAQSELERLEGIDERLDSARAKLIEADALLEDASRSLRSVAEETEARPETLEEIQDRLLEVRDLMKKNRCASVGELLAYRDTAAARLSELDKQDASCDELDGMIKTYKKELADAATKLTDSRRKIAAAIEKQMKKELGELAMKGASFSVEFRPSANDENTPGARGAETAEFLFSANPGEPARPLADVASGGELSRVMLAFKTLLNRNDTVPVLVFDEIDAGIGGLTANAIGSRLSALGKHRQVIAITHLPQVAAYADTHVKVSKQRRGGRTVMQTEIVRGEDRLRELCRMLGDSGVRDASTSMARQLLDDAAGERKKK